MTVKYSINMQWLTVFDIWNILQNGHKTCSWVVFLCSAPFFVSHATRLVCCFLLQISSLLFRSVVFSSLSVVKAMTPYVKKQHLYPKHGFVFKSGFTGTSWRELMRLRFLEIRRQCGVCLYVLTSLIEPPSRPFRPSSLLHSFLAARLFWRL